MSKGYSNNNLAHLNAAPTPEVNLVTRMATGEEAALAELYDRYSEQVFGLALRVLGSRAEAEEILADVFFQAWREAERYDGSRGSVPAWLFAITRSRAIDRVRARQRREGKTIAIEEASVTGEMVASVGSPEGDAIHSEHQRIIRAALEQLPAKQREALELAYYCGLSQSEIAAVSGEPLGTVKTRTRSALMALREKLGPVFGAASWDAPPAAKAFRLCA